ncbi:hypothetical protein ASC77_07735 [Nocardioides sp. Root1257]|uniref:hypothetical protein n=1 Tax=unclassified Nocardioides TaxID=2615069 RepID=UPI0006FB93C5|nr:MULTISPECIES: hypothetical protein [unclassified Nocardioides]KQW48622.1 hypothetical protein ASC77_07735 [Nocardioides sp. Root1257]KRC47798.1 hypothetical protein ASE24_07740 [Nocardioides sp. Root224]
MRSRVALAALVALTATAVPALASSASVDGIATRASGRFDRAVLTSDQTTLALRGTQRRLVMTASGPGPDWNRREVFSAVGARPSRDQTTCATWSAQSGDDLQEGLAVRIRRHGDRVRAITLTKNTFYEVHYVINLLTWDTARRGEAWRSVGQYDMSGVLTSDGKLDPLPWRVCLRVEGRSLSFRIWALGRDRRPSWQDPDHARSTTLPRSFRRPGRPGWYVGHVPDGGRLVYRDLVTGSP